MQWKLPGTVLDADTSQAGSCKDIFQALYLAGDLQLGQVSAISGLEPYMIQNWVRRGFLSNPVGKRYSLNQLCRILNINLLRRTVPMEKICAMLSYINGQLDTESDDLIDDSALYFLFVSLAGTTKEHRDTLENSIHAALENLPERMPGANERIQKVLKTMLLAWISGELAERVDNYISEMEGKD